MTVLYFVGKDVIKFILMLSNSSPFFFFLRLILWVFEVLFKNALSNPCLGQEGKPAANVQHKNQVVQ